MLCQVTSLDKPSTTVCTLVRCSFYIKNKPFTSKAYTERHFLCVYPATEYNITSPHLGAVSIISIIYWLFVRLLEEALKITVNINYSLCRFSSYAAGYVGGICEEVKATRKQWISSSHMPPT
jgi:hypothetical protein